MRSQEQEQKWKAGSHKGKFEKRADSRAHQRREYGGVFKEPDARTKERACRTGPTQRQQQPTPHSATVRAYNNGAGIFAVPISKIAHFTLRWSYVRAALKTCLVLERKQGTHSARSAQLRRRDCFFFVFFCFNLWQQHAKNRERQRWSQTIAPQMRKLTTLWCLLCGLAKSIDEHLSNHPYVYLSRMRKLGNARSAVSTPECHFFSCTSIFGSFWKKIISAKHLSGSSLVAFNGKYECLQLLLYRICVHNNVLTSIRWNYKQYGTGRRPTY